MRIVQGNKGNRAAGLLAAGVLALVLVAATPQQDIRQTETAGVSASVSAPTASAAATALAKMTLEQRVGQVLMMGVPATGAGSLDLYYLEHYKIGNVFLKGRNYAGLASAKSVVAKINATAGPATTGGQKRFVATDQEGGNVQVLQGPGFSVMPTALHQGTWSTSSIRTSATRWAKQLKAAGVNVNLAPVADTVPSAAFAPYNSPIGYWHREFGYTSTHVGNDAVAFAQGMKAGGVAATAKHFPGLGRVTRNTDTSANVTDAITTRTSAYIKPFARAIDAGTRWVMVSNAKYTRIDAKNIGPFSPMIMKTMLRGDLGFTGIIISDDMCSAKQLSPWTYATRARNFFNAGGTMMLCVDSSAMPAIQSSLVADAKGSPAFLAKINAAALEVLETRSGH